MPNILDEIVEQTATDLKKRKNNITYNDLEDMELYGKAPKNFKHALTPESGVAIIAEIKKASPSKGVIRQDFDPPEIARQYRDGGAAALSVLTDEPAFQGHLKDLENVASEVDIPLLRKDFIIDPYQLKEAKAYGADAALLIATITDGKQLQELVHAAQEFNLQALVECYSEADLKYVNFEHVDILGVNNRDLRTFNVDLHRGVELLKKAPEETGLVSESGLRLAEDLHFLFQNNVDAALIGEYFMRQENPGQAVQRLKLELENLIDQDSEK